MANKSRPQRWMEAVARTRAAHEFLVEQANALDNALDDLNSLREEYEEWNDNLPENLQGSTLAEKLDEVVEMDFSGAWQEVSDALDSVLSVLEEADGVDLPRGFGRD